MAEALAGSDGHLSVQRIHELARAQVPGISLSTVYRTLQTFDDLGVIAGHDFLGAGRVYEVDRPNGRHHHLIDTKSGKVVEFASAELDGLLMQVAWRLGFDVVDARLELYAVPRDRGD